MEKKERGGEEEEEEERRSGRETGRRRMREIRREREGEGEEDRPGVRRGEDENKERAERSANQCHWFLTNPMSTSRKKNPVGWWRYTEPANSSKKAWTKRTDERAAAVEGEKEDKQVVKDEQGRW
jgi:hypothetical protein